MSFDLQPYLENDLLILRPLNDGDFEPLYNVASDPLIWEQHPAKDRCQRNVFKIFFEEATASKSAFTAIDKITGDIIGCTRYTHVKETTAAISIGYTFLARKYWGGVYNGSMKGLMMAHAFNFVENVLFYIHENNIRSQKAVEKIGGIRIEKLNDLFLEPRPNATVIYCVSRSERIQTTRV